MARGATGITAAAVLTIGIAWVAGPSAGTTAAVAGSLSPRSAGTRAPIQPPVPSGMLRIAGALRDGGTVSAVGLRWRPGRLPAGYRLLSFEVGYAWQTCRKHMC
ncbi:MAG: hypothetical protein LBV34_01660, partial [Nocardiopsaceae bacterium]|nr:hypothetical protein [Nocardiopsaceae bacterium]